MAYIEPRKNKKGEITSYRIIVSDGMDLDGKQIRRIMTWTPTPGMSQHQIEKELNAAAARSWVSNGRASIWKRGSS